MMMEKNAIDLLARLRINYTSADIALPISHRFEAKTGQDLLYILITIVDRDAVEGMNYRYIDEPISIILMNCWKKNVAGPPQSAKFLYKQEPHMEEYPYLMEQWLM